MLRIMYGPGITCRHFTDNMVIAQTNSPDVGAGSYAANSSSNAFASFRSRVSNPSVNHP